MAVGGGRLLHLHLPLDLRDIEAAVLDAEHLCLLELQAGNSKAGVLVLVERVIEPARISTS